MKYLIFSKKLKIIKNDSFGQRGSIKLLIPTSFDITSMRSNSSAIINFYNPDQPLDKTHSDSNMQIDNCTFIQTKVSLIHIPCTINKTGENYVKQSIFRFTTCGFSKNEGYCEICAKTCHLGHDLIYSGKIDSFIDCGNALKISDPIFQT